MYRIRVVRELYRERFEVQIPLLFLWGNEVLGGLLAEPQYLRGLIDTGFWSE